MTLGSLPHRRCQSVSASRYPVPVVSLFAQWWKVWQHVLRHLRFLFQLTSHVPFKLYAGSILRIGAYLRHYVATLHNIRSSNFTPGFFLSLIVGEVAVKAIVSRANLLVAKSRGDPCLASHIVIRLLDFGLQSRHNLDTRATSANDSYCLAPEELVSRE